MERRMWSSPFRVILCMVVLMVVGAACIPLLNVQYSPHTQSQNLTVNFTGNGSARVMEADVAQLIEGAMNTLSGVSDMTTQSWKGGGYVSLSFKKGTDMNITRFDVLTRLRQIRDKLPEGAYCSVSGSAGRGGRSKSTLLQYTINADMPAAEIVRYANEHLVTPLSRIEGVDEVGTSGAMPLEWVLTFDPDALRSAGLTPQDLSSALSGSAQNSIVGTQSMEDRLMLVRLRSQEAPADTRKYLENIPVGKVGGRMYHMGDFVTVTYQEQTPQSYNRINGLNTIDLYVMAQDGINTLTVAEEVRNRMAQLEGQFPDGFAIRLSYDASESLSTEINKIFLRAAMSLAILMLFVLLVSRSFRYLLVIGMTIAANLLCSVILYNLFSLDIELYSMAGITVSLGIIIDTAIVMADHYSYYHNRKVMFSIVGALLTTIASLLLIFFLPADARQNLTGFIWVIVINLALSMLVAMTLTPALLDSMPQGRHGVVRSSMRRRRRLVRISSLYERFILRERRCWWLCLLLVPLITAGAFWAFHEHGNGRLSVGRDDEKPEVTLTIRANMAEGCTVQQLNDIVSEMENWLQQFQEISLFRTSLSGTSGTIEIHFKDQYQHTLFPFRLKEQMWAKAIRYGGATWSISSLDENDTWLSNSIFRTSWPNTIQLYGYSYDLLYRYAEELIDSLKTNRRVPDAGFSAGYASVVPNEFCLDYDREKVAQTGINLNRYYSFLGEQLYDSPAGSVTDAAGYTPVRMVSKEKDNFDLWHIRNDMVLIDSVETRLNDVGTITKRRTGLDIERHNQEYVISVGYDFIGSYELNTRMRDAQIDRLNAQLPMGFRAGADDYNSSWSQDKLRIILLLVIVLVIFMICASLFESLRQPFAIIMLIPASFVGLLLAYPVFGVPSGTGCFAAMVMLAGITVNAGIYIVSEYRTICSSNGKYGIRNYVKAYNRKIVPTLLTIGSTILGLVPFLIDGSQSPFWFSFAVGVMSGMLFSIIAIVLVMPAFFSLTPAGMTPVSRKSSPLS